MKKPATVAVSAAVFIMAACASDGGPFVISDSDHAIRVGGALSDSEPLSVQVKEQLRNNGQTASAGIDVSQPSADTIRLSGFVSDPATRQEAERMAYRVEGVRFVVNTIELQR